MPALTLTKDQRRQNASIGQEMEKLRLKAKLSRHQMAIALGCQYIKIWKLETGKTQWTAVDRERFEEVCEGRK